MILRAFLVWLGLLCTILLSIVILAVGWFSIGWIAPASLQEAWLIGMTWVALTVAFEFLAGHFVFGNPWALLLADYNILAGRIWVMVLIVNLVTPPLAYTSRGGARPVPTITTQR